MLGGKDLGGCHKCSLISVVCCDINRGGGTCGLSASDVAYDYAAHRLALLHICRNISDSALLRACQLVGEECCECRHVGVGAGRRGMPLDMLALRAKTCCEKEKFIKYQSSFRYGEAFVAFGLVYLLKGKMYGAKSVLLSYALRQRILIGCRDEGKYLLDVLSDLLLREPICKSIDRGKGGRRSALYPRLRYGRCHLVARFLFLHLSVESER